MHANNVDTEFIKQGEDFLQTQGKKEKDINHK